MNAQVQEGQLVPEEGMAAMINRSEIEQQISTARRFPRSLKKFRDEALQMVTLSQSIAEQCVYALPRDGKTIEGPSARFAEVVASAWGNNRAGARVIDDKGEFIIAQGVFHDLERNVAITYEVQRRIVDRQGRRFKPDMIGVTANAACSIALRNAVLKGVPKAFWEDMYVEARKVIMGDVKTLANRRADALGVFQRFGVSAEQVCAKLEVAGVEDIGLEHLVLLRGIVTAIKEGDTTPEEAFAIAGQANAPAARAAYTAEQFAAALPAWKAAVNGGKKTPQQIVTLAETKASLSDEQRKTILALGEPERQAEPAAQQAPQDKPAFPSDDEPQNAAHAAAGRITQTAVER
ncbi:hypothetical protein EA658_16470 [Pseudoxanthomonas winnipegensis]|uniref:Uncharacterized protein n=1 Tax=Pseudoxanthomonas winnipegensis TaxID=2480810 RepID=A0ABY1WCH4_9GAMM|nr:hypothetical protein [Pseudoxanthomonas winnipegensis]TAA11257.1 hypothetical protein EA659_07885 [Pseudoxanthomonas winnipegensis]TAA18680.1 hypothetical protein EA658_16470 [Pseudoxanthomonas winnipegensis]TAH73944.1 hypothetical protein EA657_00275 [Pseudoxanthomonas winnipegensis]